MIRQRDDLLCFNGGEIVIHDSIPSCKCPDGFTGTFCQTRFFELDFGEAPCAILAFLAFTVLLVGTINHARRKTAQEAVLCSRKDTEVYS